MLGATGRVGGSLVRQLRSADAPVRAASRGGSGPDGVRLDIADPATWPAPLAGVEALFLLWPPGTAFQSSVFPFIDAAQEAGVRRVAFLSVLGADRMRFLPHAKIEDRLRASSMTTVLLRAGYFFQNISTVHADDVRERDELFLPTGRGPISMVDVEDVAEAARVGLLQREDDVAWDLTGPTALTADDVARELTEALSRPIRNARPGFWRFYRSHIQRGTDPVLARFMCAEYLHARLGFAGRLGDGVREALGREPTPFTAFARREAAAWTPL